MPKVNIYLPDDLAEAVKDTGVPLSAVCQRALEQAVRRVTQIREIVTGSSRAIGTADPPLVTFTARAMKMLESARAAALSSGLAGAGTGHLLAELADDENSLAMRVLTALEISSPQVRSELARREHADAGAAAGAVADVAADAVAAADAVTAGGRREGAGRPANDDAASTSRAGLDPQAATVLELAAVESSGLGNSYIGSEHLLLGLIGEPDGVGGRVLRSLGAELRVTRRMVAAALAGWAARADTQQRPGTTAANPGVPSEQLAAAIRAELVPVLARIERLEARHAT
jgi:ATP-dependent Clp protease ATP-binding subunit ClpA